MTEKTRAKEEGQDRQCAAQRQEISPWEDQTVPLSPYLEPPCWSEPCCPPQGWGNNAVTSPPSLGTQRSLPEVTREETTGSASFGRENTPAGRGPQI